jgi:hypothetical protein
MKRVPFLPWEGLRAMLRSFFLAGIIVCILRVSAASAQAWRFGLEAGVPLTTYFTTAPPLSSSATRYYTLGPSVELTLPLGVSLELDALYKRFGYHTHVSSGRLGLGGTATDDIEVTGNSWDFPLTMKSPIRVLPHLYARGGGILRYLLSARGVGTRTYYNGFTTAITAVNTNDPGELRKRLYPGLTIGGGADFGSGRFRIQPELRYTHWHAELAGYLRFNSSELDFLLGFHF